MTREKIVVLDFGSQYAHLIAKRFRLLGFYSEIAQPCSPVSIFEQAKGIVFSGGPSSVYDSDAPDFNDEILSLNIPILGLCYGHQLLAQKSGGKVEKGEVGEFGIAQLDTKDCASSPLLKGIQMPAQVWMSHQDTVTVLPPGFETIAYTKDCPFAGVQNLAKKRFSLQFHVEVKDTPCGNTIFTNFATYCGMQQNWNQNIVLELLLQQIKESSGDKKVLLFLSGGVDSTVTFALLNKALGQERVLGLHIDNGFMRKNESTVIARRYRDFGFTNFIVEDASESFLQAVYKETDPQKKRHAIGENFITVRNKVVKKQQFDEEHWLLAQGTLYPDIIESGGTKNSKVIKTHHNRVEGIQALIEKGLIIEPLKDLYKDEVRSLGLKLGLSRELVMRHPFPGPGLSINVLGSDGVLNEPELFEKAKKSIEELDLYSLLKVNYKTTVLPVKSVGVQGDFRTYRFPAVLQLAGNTFSHFAKNTDMWSRLEATSAYITNSLSEVNRTVLCLYTKPNCTLVEGYCDKKRLDQIREADAMVLDALKKSGWYHKIFQHLTINLPYATEKGRCSIVLRPVVSEDVMTARFAQLDYKIVASLTMAIIELPFVDGLYYDLTNKPPATFGWE